MNPWRRARRLHPVRASGALRRAGLAAIMLVLVQSPLVPATGTPGPTPMPAGRVFHVDARSPAASDQNPGTAPLPLKTLRRTVELAGAANAGGTPATILVHPGTYRESVPVPAGGTGAAMILRATDAGQAVISGSDIWTGWTRRGPTPVFTHAWPYAWGLAPAPPRWPPLQDIVRRREMVFVNGRLLRQVLAPASLEEGTFFVDEAGRTIALSAPGGADPNTATVEVAVRPTLLAAAGRANLTVSGLVFEHGATPVDESAVTFDRMTNLVVQDTVVRWNNWGGLAINQSADVTAVRNIASHNGGRGMEAWRVRSLHFAGNDTSSNNWRGGWGHFTGWAAAGFKAMQIHGGAIDHHEARFNRAHGLWLDTDNEHVTITDGVWCSNLRNGGFIEASQGPITIVRATSCGNGQRGILATESSHLTVRNSALYGNGEAQFEVGGEPSRRVTNWETRRTADVRTENLTLCGNAVVGEKDGQDVLAVPSWTFLLSSLRSSRNDWWNPHTAASFRLEGSTHLDLAGWRRASGQDADSVYADPHFADPANGNFTPLAGGVWPKC
jgi:hypothetical protein